MSMTIVETDKNTPIKRRILYVNGHTTEISLDTLLAHFVATSSPKLFFSQSEISSSVILWMSDILYKKRVCCTTFNLLFPLLHNFLASVLFFFDCLFWLWRKAVAPFLVFVHVKLNQIMIGPVTSQPMQSKQSWNLAGIFDILQISYVHVHCPCQVCNSNAVSTATEHRHWSRACKFIDTDVK